MKYCHSTSKLSAFNLSDHFKEEFFQTKKVVYVPL